MTRPGLLLALAVSGCVLAASLDVEAQSSLGLRAPRTEVELSHSRESLSNNRADWTSTELALSRELRERHTLYGGLRTTRRFGQNDSEGRIGLYYPLAAAWTAVVEGSVSPSHNVLPEYSVYGSLHRMLGGGWGLAAGLRHSEYSTTGAQVTSLSAERYWGNFRGAYTLYSGRPDGAPSGAAHRFQLNYYYGERSTVGLSYTMGREVENLGAAGVLSSDVRDWTLSGRHWLTPQFALTYDLVNHEQGNLYRRQGLRIGLRHLF